jgi:hypothetical protein
MLFLFSGGHQCSRIPKEQKNINVHVRNNIERQKKTIVLSISWAIIYHHRQHQYGIHNQRRNCEDHPIHNFFLKKSLFITYRYEQ